MKLQLLILIFTALSANIALQEQSMIGMSKEEVLQKMKEEHRKFALDNTITRQQFNYLKYGNNSETVTWIIYFSEKDICTSTKKVCDYIEYDYVLKELNEKFEKVGDLTWEFKSGNEQIQVTIEEKDWYFTVRERIKPKK